MHVIEIEQLTKTHISQGTSTKRSRILYTVRTCAAAAFVLHDM